MPYLRKTLTSPSYVSYRFTMSEGCPWNVEIGMSCWNLLINPYHWNTQFTVFQKNIWDVFHVVIFRNACDGPDVTFVKSQPINSGFEVERKTAEFVDNYVVRWGPTLMASVRIMTRFSLLGSKLCKKISQLVNRKDLWKIKVTGSSQDASLPIWLNPVSFLFLEWLWTTKTKGSFIYPCTVTFQIFTSSLLSIRYYSNNFI